MSQTRSQPLRLGFVPLIDAAPMVMAQELGLFAKHGLDVQLRRQPGWATVRDKILYGDLDAAHALAVMPFAATLGLGSIRSDCVTALVLSLHGNAITLSSDLRLRGVRDARTLRAEIERNRGRKTLTFGVVLTWSSHNFLLRQWLASGGIDPDKDVRIVVVPPAAMFHQSQGRQPRRLLRGRAVELDRGGFGRRLVPDRQRATGPRASGEGADGPARLHRDARR